MRNLKEYPLTVGEMYTAIQDAHESQRAKRMIGDITGLSLFMIEQFMRAHEAELKEFIAKSPAAGNV